MWRLGFAAGKVWDTIFGAGPASGRGGGASDCLLGVPSLTGLHTECAGVGACFPGCVRPGPRWRSVSGGPVSWRTRRNPRPLMGAAGRRWSRGTQAHRRAPGFCVNMVETLLVSLTRSLPSISLGQTAFAAGMTFHVPDLSNRAVTKPTNVHTHECLADFVKRRRWLSATLARKHEHLTRFQIA